MSCYIYNIEPLGTFCIQAITGASTNIMNTLANIYPGLIKDKKRMNRGIAAGSLRYYCVHVKGVGGDNKQGPEAVRNFLLETVWTVYLVYLLSPFPALTRHRC
jgi:hypothetical protein